MSRMERIIEENCGHEEVTKPLSEDQQHREDGLDGSGGAEAGASGDSADAGSQGTT